MASGIERMNLHSKLHQPSEVSYIKRLDLNGLGTYPRVVEIDTTEACNFACPGCISEEIIGEQRKRTMAALNPAVDCRMHCIRHQANMELLRMKNEKDYRVSEDMGDRFI